MPTPEAQAIADWLYHRGERTAIAYKDRGDIAEALDRFAAQRGAEPNGGNMTPDSPAAKAMWDAYHAVPRPYHAVPRQGALPQTGGGDAGERARAAVEALPSRLFDRKHTEEIVLHLMPEFEAALREAAEAMRGVCEEWVWQHDHVVGGWLKEAALPIPGE